MKIEIHTETRLTLSDFDDPGLDLVSRDVPFSALQMFATSLGLCTWSVIAGVGLRSGADPARCSVQVEWEYHDEPFRIGSIDVRVVWPGVPEDRVAVVERAASRCTLHNTLHHPPHVTTRVTAADDRAQERPQELH